MAGNELDLKITVRDGHLKELVDVWRQAVRSLSDVW